MHENHDKSYTTARLPECGGGWKVSVGVSGLTLAADGCISIGMAVEAAVALWLAVLGPGHDDEDDDVGDDRVTVGPGLDWLSHADVDTVSVGCDSCRSNWCGWETDMLAAPRCTDTHLTAHLDIRSECVGFNVPLQT